MDGGARARSARAISGADKRIGPMRPNPLPDQRPCSDPISGRLNAWIDIIIVVQHVVSSLVNSHLFDFTQGWLYVFAGRGRGRRHGVARAKFHDRRKTWSPFREQPNVVRVKFVSAMHRALR